VSVTELLSCMRTSLPGRSSRQSERDE